MFKGATQRKKIADDLLPPVHITDSVVCWVMSIIRSSAKFFRAAKLHRKRKESTIISKKQKHELHNRPRKRSCNKAKYSSRQKEFLKHTFVRRAASDWKQTNVRYDYRGDLRFISKLLCCDDNAPARELLNSFSLPAMAQRPCDCVLEINTSLESCHALLRRLRNERRYFRVDALKIHQSRRKLIKKLLNRNCMSTTESNSRKSNYHLVGVYE